MSKDIGMEVMASSNEVPGDSEKASALSENDHIPGKIAHHCGQASLSLCYSLGLPQRYRESAIKLVKEGGAHGVKLEGGRDMACTIRAISKAGVPVIGHIGLTVQRDLDASKEADDGSEVLEDAKSVQDAGAVAVLVETMTPRAADSITKALKIPTIGIGYGLLSRMCSLTDTSLSSGP
ncbi:hypothetical protein FOPG_16220 [Fusarium oxysporum f. sp. conglutinans race 2 54008]|uniref:3-methyl-2-oxobutanoate hydroxymethyltransferase n=1 Tax=Fusarium oxysporum f. sp. conglutinans race 2 54008 TaxID=1089457 RepID=X0H6Y9_FUSOX|nr:hypothetical protein FOPG_16220 [Fusarium oxysporum f. sp. conglutinans race 2 54008]